MLFSSRKLFLINFDHIVGEILSNSKFLTGFFLISSINFSINVSNISFLSSYTIYALYNTTSAFLSLAVLYNSSIQLFSSQSSPSKNNMNSPFAYLSPVFLASIKPWFFLFITIILSSSSFTLLIIFKVLSVEPSLTIIISISLSD